MRDEPECFCLPDDVCRYCTALARVAELETKLDEAHKVIGLVGQERDAARAERDSSVSRLNACLDMLRGQPIRTAPARIPSTDESWDEDGPLGKDERFVRPSE